MGSVCFDGAFLLPDFFVRRWKSFPGLARKGLFPWNAALNSTTPISWICKNQLGRRNLTPQQKKYLIGQRYDAEKNTWRRSEKQSARIKWSKWPLDCSTENKRANCFRDRNKWELYCSLVFAGQDSYSDGIQINRPQKYIFFFSVFSVRFSSFLSLISRGKNLNLWGAIVWYTSSFVGWANQPTATRGGAPLFSRINM